MNCEMKDVAPKCRLKKTWKNVVDEDFRNTLIKNYVKARVGNSVLFLLEMWQISVQRFSNLDRDVVTAVQVTNMESDTGYWLLTVDCRTTWLTFDSHSSSR